MHRAGAVLGVQLCSCFVSFHATQMLYELLQARVQWNWTTAIVTLPLAASMSVRYLYMCYYTPDTTSDMGRQSDSAEPRASLVLGMQA